VFAHILLLLEVQRGRLDEVPVFAAGTPTALTIGVIGVTWHSGLMLIGIVIIILLLKLLIIGVLLIVLLVGLIILLLRVALILIVKLTVG